jgi:malate synthase
MNQLLELEQIHEHEMQKLREENVILKQEKERWKQQEMSLNLGQRKDISLLIQQLDSEGQNLSSATNVIFDHSSYIQDLERTNQSLVTERDQLQAELDQEIQLHKETTRICENLEIEIDDLHRQLVSQTQHLNDEQQNCERLTREVYYDQKQLHEQTDQIAELQ